MFSASDRPSSPASAGRASSSAPTAPRSTTRPRRCASCRCARRASTLRAAPGARRSGGHSVQREDGHLTRDITVSDVNPNAAVTIAAPDNVREAAAPPLRVGVEKLADGVWYLSTPNARNWAVEFNDHIVVVEGIGSEDRSLAAIEEIKKAIPNKPIPYVINTHAHYDHAGGRRTHSSAGSTVIAHQPNS